jgi:hypothetical protein
MIALLAAAIALLPAGGFQHSSGLDVVLVEQRDLPLVVLGLVVLDDPRQPPDLQAEITRQLLRARVGDEDRATAGWLRLQGGDAAPKAVADGTLWTFGVAPTDLPRALDSLAELLSRPLPVHDREGVEWGRMPSGSPAGLHQLARARALGVDARPIPPTGPWGRIFADHAAAWVVPGNARLIVAGDIDEVELRKHLDHALASWPKATPPPLPAAPPRDADSEPRAQIVGLRGAERAGYAAAFRLPPGDLRAAATWLLATEFVGARPGWFLAASPADGLYSAAARGDGTAEDLQDALLGALEALSDGLPPDLHPRRVRLVRNRLLAGFAGRQGEVNAWAGLRALGVGPGDLPALLAALDAVSDDEVAAFARALLVGSERVEVLETAP